MGESSSQEPAKSPRLRIYLCQPGQSSFHVSLGTADVQGAKLIELRARDSDLPAWRSVVEALRIEITLREDLVRIQTEGRGES